LDFDRAVWGDGTAPTIRRNVIHGKPLTGIDVGEGASGTIIGNTINGV
jgi:hypothetical protein